MARAAGAITYSSNASGNRSSTGRFTCGYDTVSEVRQALARYFDFTIVVARTQRLTANPGYGLLQPAAALPQRLNLQRTHLRNQISVQLQF